MLSRTFVVTCVTLTALYTNYKQVYVDPLKTPDPNLGGSLSRWGQLTKGGEVVNGFSDVILQYFEGLNKFFIRNTEYRNQLLIFASSLVDSMQLIQFIRWSRWGITWRLMLACAVFYLFRALVQNVWFVEKPPGYNWAFPGYISIYVGYGSTADFFYSGHVGICILHHLEFKAIGWYTLSYFSIFVMFVQAFTMVALRSHYSVDMISGALFAHYIFILSERYSYLIDWYILGIPLDKRLASSNDHFSEENPNFNGSSPQSGIGRYFISCKNCQHPIGNYMTNEYTVTHLDPKLIKEWDEEEGEQLIE